MLPLGLLALARRLPSPRSVIEAPRTVYPTSRREHMLDAFTITHDDRLALQDALYQESITTYEAALTAEAERLGMASSGVYLMNAEELAWIHARAEFAANSVTNTYNTRLVSQVAQLLKDEPKSNRDVLVSKLEKWWATRSEAQGAAVSLTETAMVAQRALEEFYTRNNISGECYFGGSELCERCQEIAASCPVSVAEMRDTGIPHISCGDIWTVEAGPLPSDDQAWLGQ